MNWQAAQAAAPARRNPSFVYVAEDSHGRVKIGVSADPNARLAQLQTGNPLSMRMAYVAAVKSDNGAGIERAAHETLARHRQSGEWFGVSVEMAVAAINAASFRLADPVVSIAPELVGEVIGLAAASPAPSPPAPRASMSWLGVALFIVGLCVTLPVIAAALWFLFFVLTRLA
jgi:hypothetical protein